MALTSTSELEPELEIIDLTQETSDSEEGDYDEEDFEADIINDASRAQLRAVIHDVPEAQLRHVVASLADTVPAVHRALAKELLTIAPVSRVVVPRWETCGNCGETYDVNDDEDQEDSCTFHPGTLVTVHSILSFTELMNISYV